MNKYGLPVLCSLLIWLAATLFFMVFGAKILTEPGNKDFLFVFIMLELGTLLLLSIVFFIYQKLDSSEVAALKLGVIGTAIGLFMDTWSLWNKEKVFPNLTDGQISSFTIWMAFAYGIFLVIPFLFTKRAIRKLIF